MNNHSILHWSYRDFYNLPDELIEYGGFLEEIYLKENYLSQLPLWVFELNNLRFIHLAGNLLTAIPDEISLLKNLEFFDLSHNKLQYLPKTIGELVNLKRFNIEFNEIVQLPEEIGELRALEYFSCNKNKLTQLPVALTRCHNLIEFITDENYSLTEIPTKLFSMKYLTYLSANRCNLYYLPYTLSRNENFVVKIFENILLTHYPLAFERHIPSMFDNLSKFHNEILFHNNLTKVLVQNEQKLCNFPMEIRHIYPSCGRYVPTLFELSMREVYKCYNTVLPNDIILPNYIYQYLIRGPIAKCHCSHTIHRECYMCMVKRTKTSANHLFTQLFCSKDCMDKWYNVNRLSYHNLEWILIS